jgi:hypothetical protein
LQVDPQTVPLQFSVALAGAAGHAEHDEVPHELSALLLAQTPLHRW